MWAFTSASFVTDAAGARAWCTLKLQDPHVLLQVRKGMVLVDERAKPAACWEFDADIAILTHSTTIQPRYQVSVDKLLSLAPGQADVFMGKLLGVPALARTAM